MILVATLWLAHIIVPKAEESPPLFCDKFKRAGAVAAQSAAQFIELAGGHA